MKNLFLSSIIAIASSSSFASDMLGDTIIFERLYPNTTTLHEPAISRIVSAGESDQLFWGAGAKYAIMNPEATSFIYSAILTGGYIGSPSIFDGYRFSGFSNDILDARIIENTTGLSFTLTHDLRTILLNVSESQSIVRRSWVRVNERPVVFSIIRASKISLLKPLNR